MNKKEKQTIGVIGVGLLGSSICFRLREADYPVIGFDSRSEQLDYLVHIGGQVGSSVKELVSKAKVILLSLPDSTVSSSVCEQIAKCATAGTVVIDTTTGTPDDAVEIATNLGRQKIQFMDATVAGSSSQVKAGEGVFMVGGDTEHFQQQQALLKQLSNVIFHVGPVGSGARLKLIVNLAIGLHRAVLAESLALAEASGVDLPTALQVLKATPAYSAAMDTKGKKMIQQDFSPQARLRQHRKDVRLIRQLAAQNEQSLPLSDIHAKLLDVAINAGLGELDNSAIYQVLRDNLS